MVKRSRCRSYILVTGPRVATVADDTLLVLGRKVEGTVRRLLVDNGVGAFFQDGWGWHFDTEREDRDDLLGLDRGPLYTYLQEGAKPPLTGREGAWIYLAPIVRRLELYLLSCETRWLRAEGAHLTPFHWSISKSARCFSCFSCSIAAVDLDRVWRSRNFSAFSVCGFPDASCSFGIARPVHTPPDTWGLVRVGREGGWDLIVAARVPGGRSTGVAFPHSVPSPSSGPASITQPPRYAGS